MYLQNDGYCHSCDQKVTFSSAYSWLRDHYLCPRCGSVPRERALSYCIALFAPAWQKMRIHESSPVLRGASLKLKASASDYLGTYYFPDVPPGDTKNGNRCENLESLTFADDSIDLHVSQDVLEHVFHPDRAFREIARTLRPGGMHIFTVPLVNKEKPTEVCARLGPDGAIEHLREPEYHGNPISDQGALVVHRWGYDICDFIFKSSGLFTKMVVIDSLEWGIRAEYIEVLVSQKPAP
jgi:SAM-dependent methyltransferase